MPILLPTKIKKYANIAALVLWISALLTWHVNVPIAHAGNSQEFPAIIQESRFVAYTPRGFSVNDGKVMNASRVDIRKDLKILRPYFDGLITYSATNGIEDVAGVASELKYRAVIMGIWDPSSEIEINNVLQAYRNHPTLVAAVIVGNEGLYAKRYSPSEVRQAIKQLKKTAPNLAVTTSEPFFLYFSADYADFFKSHDLLMPNIHPIFEKWFNPNEPAHGITMVIDVTEKLHAAYRLPVLIKETGMPSGETAQGYLPTKQALFWNGLSTRFPTSSTMTFAYFEAFDAPWKPAHMASEFPGDHANEAYWGLFTTNGQAKEVVRHLHKLPQITSKDATSGPH